MEHLHSRTRRTFTTKLIRALLLVISFVYVFMISFEVKAQARETHTVGNYVTKKKKHPTRELESLNRKSSVTQNLSASLKSRITCPYHGPDAATVNSSGIFCLNGVTRGMWFPWDVARLMLKDLYRGRAAIQLVPSLEFQLTKKSQTILLLKEQNKQSEEVAARYQKLSAAQHKQLQTQNAWYKSKPFWFTVGVVTTIVVGITGAKIYQGLK